MPGLFRCRICGEVYFGKHPSHCPHCGAGQAYMIPIINWKDENKGVVPNEEEKDFLIQTRDLEFHASRLYRAAAKKSENEEIRGFFKYLARTEKEHYEVACKMLGQDISDEINGIGDDAKDTDRENILESKRLEEHVSNLYREFSDKSENSRIKDFFKALAEVETGHIHMDEEEIKHI